MRGVRFVLVLLALTSAAAAQRRPLGVYGEWAAFQEKGGEPCFAVAEPLAGRREGSRTFAALASWRSLGVGSQVYFRLRQPKRPGSAILLRIDDRTFQLVGGGVDAWAPDARADAGIVAAMRTGMTMTIETRSAAGAPIRDRYALRGAATAIDAAALACVR